MAVATLEVKGIDEIIAAFEHAPDVVEEEVLKTMQTSLDTFKQAVQLGMDANWPPGGKNFGTLQASVATEIEGTPVDLTGFVKTPLIYGRPVEDGRAAGRMPPVDAIELWVIRKLGIASPESRGVAFVIARAIGRGTTRFQRAGGAKMFAKGFETALPLVEGEWDRLLDNILARI